MSLKCLHCFADLEEDDCIDFEDYGSECVRHVVGHCLDCGKEYQWEEVYKFDRFRNIEEC